MPAYWSFLEISLAALSMGVVFHARTESAFDSEIYVAAVLGFIVLVVGGIGFRKQTNWVISASSGAIGLMVLGWATTEIVLGYAFTGHLLFVF